MRISEFYAFHAGADYRIIPDANPGGKAFGLFHRPVLTSSFGPGKSSSFVRVGSINQCRRAGYCPSSPQRCIMMTVKRYQLATRLFHTPANPVPSERSFSSMNIVHSKSRNRLTVERVGKMLYIQANRRTLGRVSKPAAQLEEEELETTDDDDVEDLNRCRYSVAESTGVSGTVGTGSEYIPV